MYNMTVGLNDHVGWMAEVHSRRWSHGRSHVSFATVRPARSVNRLREYTTLLDVNIHLHVSCFHGQYAPRSSTLCIMQHTMPMPFDMFQ